MFHFYTPWKSQKTNYLKVCMILSFLFSTQNSINPIEFTRGGPRAAATSKMERFVITVNGWKLLTIITKRSILDIE